MLFYRGLDTNAKTVFTLSIAAAWWINILCKNFGISNFSPWENILEKKRYNMLKTLLNVIDKIGFRMCGQGEFRFIQFFLFILIQNSKFSQRLIYMTRRENTLNKFHLKNKYSSFQNKSIFRARSFRRNTFLV